MHCSNSQVVVSIRTINRNFASSYVGIHMVPPSVNNGLSTLGTTQRQCCSHLLSTEGVAFKLIEQSMVAYINLRASMLDGYSYLQV